MSEEKGNFERVLALIQPIVFANAPTAVSIGCAKTIAEDITYLITHGYTMEIYNNGGKKVK